MAFCRQVNFFISARLPVAILLFVVAFASCTAPRKFPKDKPFIYKSVVDIVGTDLGKAETQQLKTALRNQMDDSLQVRTVIALRWTPPFFYNRLSRPAVFDTMYIGRSKTLMSALLKSRGYFYPQIRDSFTIKNVKKQKRVHVRFIVSPGKVMRFDSIGYDMTMPELQTLAMNNRKKSLLKKDAPYSIQTISNELDRLLNIYRDSGYYKISREDLYAEHDTVVAALIDPGLDPFEQFELLDSLSKKKREPTINIVFKQRVAKDSTHFNKYYWNQITVFPDHSILADSNRVFIDTASIAGYKILPTTRKFKTPFIARNVFISPGSIYRQSDYFKTVNTFTNLGAWSEVDIDIQERGDSLLNANIFLYPAKKQSLTIDFETSRNTNDVVTAGSLFGIGLNIGVRNRNAFRESITTASNLRFGVELGPNIVQTLQASFSHNIYIPRFITPFNIKKADKVVAPRTIINFNTSYTDRRNLYELRSVNTSWGYEWSVKNHSWQYIPFNFEYTSTNKADTFKILEERIPSLAQAFNNGLIISQIGVYTTGHTKGNKASFLRAKLEESGALFGLIKNLEDGDLRRFLKLDLEYKYFINQPKSTWAFRAFGGYGYVYGKTNGLPENNLPFFKAYFGGGPYSMRAWTVRRLGLGSATQYDTVGNGRGIDRWGDIKLEGNIEYRFDIGNILGVKLESALFADVGNIWGKTFDSELNRVDAAEFNLRRVYTDLAVGAGTSLRFDFEFFLIRFDWAYPIKNPFFAEANDGWFHKLQLNSGQFQLGIGYPF